ncbi:MAG: hypothetical protein GXO73_12305, partial [Calditrichaeota bacterium]|nr:hypothetical protein [Calditrichota bacterium]
MRRVLSLFGVLLLVFTLPVHTRAQIPSHPLTFGTWIREWLVCGPFPNPLPPGFHDYPHDRTCIGFYTD